MIRFYSSTRKGDKNFFWERIFSQLKYRHCSHSDFPLISFQFVLYFLKGNNLFSTSIELPSNFTILRPNKPYTQKQYEWSYRQVDSMSSQGGQQFLDM